MDQTHLLALGKELLLLISPLVAQGAIQKLGEDTTDHAMQLTQRAWVAIQRRFTGTPKAEAALMLYEDEPNDPGMQQRVAQQIATCFYGNQAAIVELQAVVRELRAATATPAPQRTHIQTFGNNAQVGTAVAGDVYGGLTVGPIDFSKKTIVATSRPGTHAAGTTPLQTAAHPSLPSTLSADGQHFTYGHALLIGVGDYQHAGLSVGTTSADAKRFGELLRDPQLAGYPAEQVRVLVDAQATRAGILAALDAFAQQLATAPQATALIFFAGHGTQHDNTFYLLAHEYSPTDLTGTAISAQEFHAKIAAIRQHAQKLIVLLNCCHSGGVGDQVLDEAGGEPAGDTPPLDFYQPLITGSGQVVISAARPWQKAGAIAPATPQHTVFGARLLDALRGQAPGDAPGIGVFELFSYLSTRIPADARQIRYKNAPLAQEPLLYAHQLDHNIAVTLRPGWQGGTLDADFETTIADLAQIEIELAGYSQAAQAPTELLARRDALLARLESAE